MTHVPYRGIAPAVTDVIAGHVQVTFAGLAPVRQHIASGARRGAGDGRARAQPGDARSAHRDRAGLQGRRRRRLVCAARSARHAAAVIEKLNAEFNALLLTPDLKQRIEQTGEVIIGGSLCAGQRMKGDFDRYGEIVKRLNITAE